MKRTTRRTLQEILDSDDEISIDYIETPCLPAYLDDNRFEYMRKLNMETKSPVDYIETPCLPGYLDDNQFEYMTKINKETKSPGIISGKDVKLTKCSIDKEIKALLCKNDAFCVWCVQSIPSDTLLWFLKFLLVKDIQTNYQFLRSCLIPKYDINTKMSCKSDNIVYNTEKSRFKVILN